MSRTPSTSDSTIASLTAEVERLRRADAAKAEQIASMRRQVGGLRDEFTTPSSRFIQPQGRYEALSYELSSVRSELRASTSRHEDKDRTIAALVAQVEEWKRTDALKEELIVTTRRQAEDLQRELTSSSSRMAELAQRYEIRWREVSSLQDQLQDKESGNDRLLSQVEEWKRSDATKGEELVDVRKDLAELRRDLAGASSQIEFWKRSDATKTEELVVAQKDIEQLQTQIERYKEQSRDLKSQLDDVQRFLATADTYSDKMIIQMLQKLDAEVQQNTTFMAECILGGLGPRATSTEPTGEQSSAGQMVSESIGQTLAGCLGSKSHDDLLLYLPIAFQAFLTYYLQSVISSWTIKKDCDEFINEMYERLQESGKKLNFDCHQLFC